MSPEETVTYLAENNKEKNNLGKLVEECAELTEVLVKCMTKVQDHRPLREKIVEELGDVVFRIAVFVKQNGMEDEVEERVKVKSEQVNQWINESKYVGGV